MQDKLWGSRFKHQLNPLFKSFSSSLSEDYRLAPFDIEASKAHCIMLQRIGILKPANAKRLLRGFDLIKKRLPTYKKDFLGRKFEDIHSFLELELERVAGKEAQKIHTGRSRNDQVNQATRLYVKDAIVGMYALISGLQKSVLKQARRHEKCILPGMTHLQKAQPILLAHQFLSYVESMERSKERLREVYARADVLSLGSGAIAGTALPLQREWMKKKLGLSRLSLNSLDAVGSRDFITELVFDLALIGVDLSRIAEDMLLGQIEELGWFESPESLCTGSSMMPQKKNADFLELSRGSAAILIGNVNALLILMKGLPSSYQRDLQWDKTPLFKSVELTHDLLALFREWFDGLKVNQDNIKKSLGGDFWAATDIAEHLVQRGIPFRQAHHRVGSLVRFCMDKGIYLAEAPPEILRKLLGPAFKKLPSLQPLACVTRKKSLGGTAPSLVSSQLRRWEKGIRASF
jgi:argininosuccinate lyase